MKNLVPVHLLALDSRPVFEQLQLEEALLRLGTSNYCLINHQSPPAIVMGISGKADELIDGEQYARRPVPIIRRFSGGGCVLVGRETLFLTFIFNRKDIDIGICPKRLLQWTEGVLQPAFSHTDFCIRENDYCLGDKKFGGNAQYFTKDRWLHHTSLLWDYSPVEMKILKMPPKMPTYRHDRDHGRFLTAINVHFESRDAFFQQVIASLQAQYRVVLQSEDEVRHLLTIPHRKATTYIEN